MTYLEPHLMRTFRWKLMNPVNMHRCCRILLSYRGRDLCNPACAYEIVDRLSRCLCVPVTPAQRANAANWLMRCCVDPHNPVHRRRMWGLLRSY